jgi:hypothetical protein
VTSERHGRVKGWICPECGLQYDPISPSDVIAAVRTFPRRYREVLLGFTEETGEDPDAVVRRRPEPSTWSALEYTAHVRDALGWLADDIRRINVEREPTIPDIDPDAVATSERYNEQDPETVLAALAASAERLAAVLGSVDAGDWGRIGHFEFGDRDALTMARNAAHEGSHHLRDVDRVLRAVIGKVTPP